MARAVELRLHGSGFPGAALCPPCHEDDPPEVVRIWTHFDAYLGTDPDAGWHAWPYGATPLGVFDLSMAFDAVHLGRGVSGFEILKDGKAEITLRLAADGVPWGCESLTPPGTLVLEDVTLVIDGDFDQPGR